MNERVRDAESVFLAALDRATPRERAAYVEGACGGNPEILGRVLELLSGHDQSHGPLDAPPPGLEATADDSPVTERPGTLIGLYKLLQQIGEGGMGTVFMAEQTHPVQRKVALKVIKAGMDSRQVIARFEAERQVLAIMDHVNIARVFDAGATESGRPYFVMELIHGVPITKYCDDNHLTPRERLELFVPVCQAIQHAHQKGIIHRDIKPSNVMVTLYDGKPVPKVIDFGVAKAIEQKLTERTLFTQYGTMVGTLEYMSPEQAEMSALGVDTRSDIYSLGVLLYELLTGSTPLDRKRIREAAYGEILRMIKEEEPPKPSTRLSDSGEALASISAQRKTEPAKLSRLMRGELDWIVMKTLEKDRNRRYETANGFAADVHRYLDDEPVLACPPSTVYKFSKFARRNRAILATVGMVAAILVLGTALSTWQALRATWAYHAEVKALEAEADQRIQAEEQRNKADTQRKRAQGNLELAFEALNTIYLREGKLRSFKGSQAEQVDRQFLQRGLEFYEKFAERNSMDSAARLETAKAYRSVAWMQKELGRPAEAEAAYRKALTSFEKLAGESPEIPDSSSDLSNCLIELGELLSTTNHLPEAEQTLRRAVAVATTWAARLPDKSDDWHDLPDAQIALGNLLKNTGRPHEAEVAFRDALSVYEKPADRFRDIGRYNHTVGGNLHNLANILAGRGELAEARKLYERAIRHQQASLKVLPGNMVARRFLRNHYEGLGETLQLEQNYFEALAAHRQALAVNEELAADFPNLPEFRLFLGISQTSIGALLYETGQPKAAELALRQAVSALEKLAGAYPNMHEYPAALGYALGNLSSILEGRGELAEARKVVEQACSSLQAALEASPTNPRYRRLISGVYSNWALMLLRQEEHAEAARRAAQMAPVNPENGDDSYNAACLLARCVSLVEKDATLQAPDTRQATGQMYADQAVELLRQAVTAGFKGFDHIQKDPDLKAIRNHPGYKQLVAQLAAGQEKDKK